jgi:hypothetical protein
MRTFIAKTEGQNRLGLRELLERYANEQWVADHMTVEQASNRAYSMSPGRGPSKGDVADVACGGGEGRIGG